MGNPWDGALIHLISRGYSFGPILLLKGSNKQVKHLGALHSKGREEPNSVCTNLYDTVYS